MAGTTLLGVDTHASLEAVLKQALADDGQEADAVLVTGDIAHQALRDVYARLLPTLQQYTDAPVLCVAGNHDVLDIMQMVKGW